MGVLRQVFAPWLRPGTTWRALAHVLLDAPLGLLSCIMVATLAIISVSTAVVFPVAVAAVALLFLFSRVAAHIERSRFAALLNIELIDPVLPLEPAPWWRRAIRVVTSAARWREIAYHVLHLPLGLVTTTTVVLAWCGSAGLLALPFTVGNLADRSASFGLFEVGPGAGAVVAGLAGLLGLILVAPWATVAMAGIDKAVGRWLLSRDPQADFEARVSELETSRSAAVDSAEGERRRIERDLHDGAQQRLVALAMDLGVARQRMEHDPEEGKALVAAAHEEVKAAIKELRDLVRGIHPVILEDRGLDAALSAVVARAPVPVTLKVDGGTCPDGVSVEVPARRMTAIMGPSGSGRSTLMHCLAGLDHLDSGRAYVGGVELGSLSDKELTLLRRRQIGFVFQSFNLVPTLTALENITLPLDLAGTRPDRGWMDALISATGLGDRLSHRPAELSGGQQQRVAVARALASRPQVIFADEPTGNLDSRASTEILALLRDAVDTFHQSVVMVTHDPVSAGYADEAVFLADGRIVDNMARPSAARVLDHISSLGN